MVRMQQHGSTPFLGCIVASLFLLAPLSHSVAGDKALEPSKIHPDKNKVSIAIRPDVQPFVAEEGRSGLEIDIVRAILDRTQFAPNFVQLPRVRMLQTFNAKGVDGALTSNIALEGEGCVTDWYIEHQNVGVTLADRMISVRDINDVSDLSIVTFDGATRYLGPKFAEQAKKSPRYIESSDQTIHVSLLYFGYFDMAIGDEWILKLAQVNQKNKTGAFQPLTTHRILPTTYYGARFHDNAVCRAFNEGLASIRGDGTYDRIVGDYIDRISAQIQSYESELVSAQTRGAAIQ